MAISGGPKDESVRPSGAEGDGMDRYPTYRDGPGSPHRTTATKPTDVGLPRSKRTFALPLLIALAVFAAVVIIRIVWGSMNVATTADDALSPGDPASPAIEGAPAAGAAPDANVPATAAERQEPAAVIDPETEGQTSTGPGEVEATPGGVDVPGGSQTSSPAGAAPTPAQ